MILERLEQLYAAREAEIERFLAEKRAEAAPFLTNSVDLRHSGERLVPVDVNLYPAGFHNLSARAEARAARFLAAWREENLPHARRLLIVPESHTRNLAYRDNLAALVRIAEAAGFDAAIGSLREGDAENPLPEGQSLLRRRGNRVETAAGFDADLIVLNNDCTAGPPPLLQGIEQPVLPPVAMGWWRRRKSAHFAAYRALSAEFSARFGLDPWLIAAEFKAMGGLDFKAREGVDALARAVDGLIGQLRGKHAEYGIHEDPYVFVKADGGTYGMGIMVVREGSEVLEMNKKERNKMQVIKEGAEVSEVIIQEGVPTADTVEIDGAETVAEPMVYLIDGVPVGGMFRANATRDRFGNLNAAGMRFAGMCDENEAAFDCRRPVRDCHFRAYGLIAALSALACPREEYGAL